MKAVMRDPELEGKMIKVSLLSREHGPDERPWAIETVDCAIDVVARRLAMGFLHDDDASGRVHLLECIANLFAGLVTELVADDQHVEMLFSHKFNGIGLRHGSNGLAAGRA
jgi:hypothetical protein